MPDPPTLPVDGLADELIALYRDAERKLDRLIVSALSRGAPGTARYFLNQQRQVSRILRELRIASRPLEAGVIRGAYATGTATIDRTLTFSQAFSGVHGPSMEVLAANLTGRLRYSREFVGRRANDAIRRASLREVALAVGAGLSPRQQTRSLTAALERIQHEQIRRDGTTAFVDARGRRWPLSTYAAMVSRTTTREAVSVGMRNRMIDHGKDLVTISSHRRSCEICLPYQGRTYSISGTSSRYPKLDEMPPFHPNCRHVLTPAAADFEAIEQALGLGPGLVPETATPEPTPTPASTRAGGEVKVRDVLNVKARDAYVRESAEVVMSTVEGLHGFSRGRKVDLSTNSSINAEADFGASLFEQRIRVNSKYLKSKGPGAGAFAISHELGHAIDWRLADEIEEEFTPKFASTMPDNPARRVVEAATGTHSIHRIAEDGSLPISLKVRRYLLNPKEVFARAYSQWLAMRSDDPNMRAALEAEISSPVPWQWEEDDFAPVAAAIEAMLREFGWQI